MNNTLYPYLCPFCGKTLSLDGKSYVCDNKHLFDISKSGYVNLLPVNKKNSLDPGDNKDMIKARGIVMDKGYYQKLAQAIVSLLKPYSPKSILDAGCGIGYLTNELHLGYPNSRIVGADISKFAISYASKKYKDIAFAVSSSNSLPIKSHSIDMLLCAFAPVFEQEFLRVLVKGGIFIRVVPAPRHLFNLKELLYKSATENQLDPEQIDGFTLLDAVTVADTFCAENAQQLMSLVQMTPYFYHANKEAIAQLCNIDTLCVIQEFEIRLYAKD